MSTLWSSNAAPSESRIGHAAHKSLTRGVAPGISRSSLLLTVRLPPPPPPPPHVNGWRQNEVVVSSDAWLAGLPYSVEALFVVRCAAPHQTNLRYNVDDGLHAGTAADCAEARARAIAMHRAYLLAYGLDARAFPLLELRPSEWDRPFAPLTEVNADVKANLQRRSDQERQWQQRQAAAAALAESTPGAARAVRSGSALPITLPAAHAHARAPSPAPTAAVHCHTCEAHHAASGRSLSSARCNAMLHDRRGKMWAMWAADGWNLRAAGQPACFETGWRHLEFAKAVRGDGCSRNWLEGVAPRPRFKRPSAPALLGFDETIYAYCSAAIGRREGPFYQDNQGLARRCVDASENVLRLMGCARVAVDGCYTSFISHPCAPPHRGVNA